MYLLECVFILKHCIFTLVGSKPFRGIPLLGDSSLCRGNIFFRYRERSRRRLILETDFEESRVVALMFLDNMY